MKEKERLNKRTIEIKIWRDGRSEGGREIVDVDNQLLNVDVSMG